MHSGEPDGRPCEGMHLRQDRRAQRDASQVGFPRAGIAGSGPRMSLIRGRRRAFRASSRGSGTVKCRRAGGCAGRPIPQPADRPEPVHGAVWPRNHRQWPVCQVGRRGQPRPGRWGGASCDWRRAPPLGGRRDRRCPAHGRRSGRPVRGSPCHGGAFACRVAGGPGAGTAGGRWPAAPGRSPASRPARSTPRLGVDYASSASTRAAQMKSLSESPPTSWVDHSTWQWP